MHLAFILKEEKLNTFRSQIRRRKRKGYGRGTCEVSYLTIYFFSFVLRNFYSPPTRNKTKNIYFNYFCLQNTSSLLTAAWSLKKFLFFIDIKNQKLEQRAAATSWTFSLFLLFFLEWNRRRRKAFKWVSSKRARSLNSWVNLQ